jgi:hypothetical protein
LKVVIAKVGGLHAGGHHQVVVTHFYAREDNHLTFQIHTSSFHQPNVNITLVTQYLADGHGDASRF